MDMKVDSGVMERHLLQQGPIISSWDPQPRKVSGSWAQAGVATLLNLGGEGSAEVTQPGWITCSQGTITPPPSPYLATGRLLLCSECAATIFTLSSCRICRIC